MQIVTFLIGAVSMLFLAVLLGTLIGGVVGWIVGAVFPVVIVTLNTLTGLTLTGFEMGLVLGFVSGFFKQSTN